MKSHAFVLLNALAVCSAGCAGPGPGLTGNDTGGIIPWSLENRVIALDWAEQGMLMLNAVLTVRAHQPNSHKNKGWEVFTDAVIRAMSAKESQVVFVLWGGYARKKTALIDTSRHVVIESAHPSPLSARNGSPFFNGKTRARSAGSRV